MPTFRRRHAYEQALTVTGREAQPREWVSTQIPLAEKHDSPSRLRTGAGDATKSIESAIRHAEAARTRAQTRDGGPADKMARAIAGNEASLTVLTCEEYPDFWGKHKKTT